MPVSHEQLFRLASTVVHKSNTDSAFRTLALKDGTAAVEQVLGAPVPDGVKIRFVENDGATFVMGLPPGRTAGELSDHELEAVAGGRDEEVNGSEIGAQIAEQLPDMAASFFKR